MENKKEKMEKEEEYRAAPPTGRSKGRSNGNTNRDNRGFKHLKLSVFADDLEGDK